MDIDGGNDIKRKIRRKKYFNNPRHEIWFEILTRLSVKSLLTCRVVCKSWEKKCYRLQQLESNPLPLCGIIIKSSFGVSSVNATDMYYINISTKEVTSMRPNDPKSQTVSVASNGNDEYKLMSDASFDFGGLFQRNPCRFAVSCPGKALPFDFDKLWIDNRQQSQSCFFAVDRGLVLVVHEDGNYLVHNPLTREVTRLPKPLSFKKYDPTRVPIEKIGFISNNFSSGLRTCCLYNVVRVCRIAKVIEVYKSYQQPLRWRATKLILDKDLIQACWYWENNAIFTGHRTLFFLTNKDRGVAIKFGTRSRPEAYGFGLPRLVQDGFENARLGTCGECLHLSYYNPNGFWIWKHEIDGSNVTADTWAPLLEVSRYRQLCKPLALQCVFNVLNVGGTVVPLAFHPVAPVVFLCINSCVVAYDFEMDTFNKIVEIAEINRGSSMVALPYSPCLASVVTKRIKPPKNAPPSQDDVMMS